MFHDRWALALFLVACTGDPKTDDDAAPADDADVDTDTDADTDTDVEDADQDGFAADDCDDGDAAVYPGAPDLCGDDRRTDCDRLGDEGLVTVDGTTSYATLGEALAGAASGADVLICPGTYVGQFAATVPLTLRSHGGSAVAILDGGGAGVTLSVVPDSEIVGLSITNGQTTGLGAGLVLTTGGALTVTDSELRDNEAVDGAGLSLPAGSTAVIAGTVVSGNRAEDHGGGIYAIGSSLDLTTSVVSGNQAGFGGGGVALVDGTLVGGEFTDNLARSAGPESVLRGGGGLALDGACVVTGAEVHANEGGWGAGIAVTGGPTALVDLDVHDNRATGEFGTGGGLAMFEADVSLEGTTRLYQNSATASGGGATVAESLLTGGLVETNATDAAGGGLAVSGGTVEAVTVSGNTAIQGGGVYVFVTGTLVDLDVTGNQSIDAGGVMVSSDVQPGALTMVRGVISGNSSDTGGGLVASNADAQLEGTSVTDNTTGIGGALFLKGGTVTVTDGEVLRNSASDGGGGAAIFGGSVTSVGSSWGAGADDNVPDDIVTGVGSYVGYEADEDFVCDDAGCVPEP